MNCFFLGWAIEYTSETIGLSFLVGRLLVKNAFSLIHSTFVFYIILWPFFFVVVAVFQRICPCPLMLLTFLKIFPYYLLIVCRICNDVLSFSFKNSCSLINFINLFKELALAFFISVLFVYFTLYWFLLFIIFSFLLTLGLICSSFTFLRWKLTSLDLNLSSLINTFKFFWSTFKLGNFPLTNFDIVFHYH